MTWADFYLLCFVVGFGLSLLSFLGVHLHLPFQSHFPNGWGGHAHVHVGHGAGHVGGHAAGHAGSAGGTGGEGAGLLPDISPFNFLTLTAFLAWFGGTGYLLTRYSSLWTLFGFGLAVLVGLVGASIVFLFMAKVLTSPDENLDPADFRMEGVLGRVIIPIRTGGTGEIVYSQGGTRRNASARSDESVAIEKGTEVIVTRYENGIAYVRRWEDMAGEESQAQSGR
jgi:membrane protein implicated in regulation of membrane protease activity